MDTEEGEALTAAGARQGMDSGTETEQVKTLRGGKTLVIWALMVVDRAVGWGVVGGIKPGTVRGEP